VVKTGVTLVGKAGELVRSSESGKVVYAGDGLKGYGNLLIVKHRDEFLTAYGYNKRLLVKEGSVVKKGQAIAEIGKDNKNRPALFFEIRRRGKAVSVTEYMPNKGR
jgi:lipoprotein NlpD